MESKIGIIYVERGIKVRTDKLIRQERLLLQTYLEMFRKLCNLSGETFGLKVAGITKQSISKYESGVKDAEINLMLYIAIRQFLDYESKKNNRMALREALRLFDGYMYVSVAEQAEIMDKFMLLMDHLNNESRKENEEERDKERLEIIGGLDFGISDYEQGEWYKRYQEELQDDSEEDKIASERDEKIIMVLSKDWSVKKIAEEFNYPLNYVIKIKNEIAREVLEEHTRTLKAELTNRTSELVDSILLRTK